MDAVLRAPGSHVSSTAVRTLPTKALRVSYRVLKDILSSLHDELALLHLLWYQNATQFRTAKWWQSIDAVRRCGIRISGTHKVPGKAKACRAERDPGSRKTRPAALRTLANYALLWDAMSLEDTFERRLTSWIRLNDLPASLPKLQAAPTAPSATILHKTIEDMLELSDLLQELRIRSHSAWEILSAHLRTPPAPTFAPLVMVLLGICGRIDTLSSEALWGPTPSSDEVDITATPAPTSKKLEPKRTTSSIATLYAMLVAHLQTLAGPSSGSTDSSALTTRRNGRGHHRRPGPFSTARRWREPLAHPTGLPQRIDDRVILPRRETVEENSKMRRKRRRAEERGMGVDEDEDEDKLQVGEIREISHALLRPSITLESSNSDRVDKADKDEGEGMVRSSKKRKRKRGLAVGQELDEPGDTPKETVMPASMTILSAHPTFGFEEDDVGEAVQR